MQSEQRIGRYTVLHRLGRGGMGKVYLARDPELDRLVALKLLHREEAYRPEARELFRREARALAALSHPGIVTIYEIAQDGPRDFIAMEYLPGRSLRQEIESAKRSPAELLRVLTRVAVALAAAHGAGVLHRDVKPDNVMVAPSGGVKVVDFGVARRLADAAVVRSSESTPQRLRSLADVFTRTLPSQQRATVPVTAVTDTIFGTPAYMPPEVLAAQGAGPKSDVYSLGVVIYECLTGRLPYKGETLIETLEQVTDPKTQPPRLDELDPGLAVDLADLVDRTLAHLPDRRPTMEQLADELAQLAAAEARRRAALDETGEAVGGEPTPSSARGRSPWVAMIGTAAAVAAISALAVSFWVRDRGRDAPAAENAAKAAGRAAASAPIRVAVEPFRARIFSYANSQPSSTAISDLVGGLLSRVGGLQVVSARQLRDQVGPLEHLDPAAERAAVELDAAFLVRGSLVERSGQIVGEIQLYDLTRKKVLMKRSATGEVERMDELLAELAGAVAGELVPGATVEPSGTRRSLGSLENYERGTNALYRADWSNAAIYLERAVSEAPDFFDAWYYLALARGWAGTHRSLAVAAIERAVELGKGDDRALAEGVAHFMRYDNAGARQILKKLLEKRPRNRDAAYFLAEAEFHDGMYEEAVKQFRHTLEIAPRFKLAAVHPLQYAIARRDEQSARYFRGVLGHKDEASLDFAMGRYKEAIASDNRGAALHSYVVLDRLDAIPADLEPDPKRLGGQMYRLARAAAAGRRSEAGRWFQRAWAGIEEQAGGPSLEFKLAQLGEIVVTAGMKPETRTLLDYWKEHPPAMPSQTRNELALFAAPLLDDRSLAESRPLNARVRTAAQAIRAELRGDHDAAADLLKPLVADPSPDYDFLQRDALARNLHAAGRRAELEALCRESARPPVFRWALLTVRSRCRRYGALPH